MINKTGVWVARTIDGLGAYPFAGEIDALRYAVDHHMKVVFVPWGEAVNTYEPPPERPAKPAVRST